MSYAMNTITMLDLRQSLSKVALQMEQTGEPMLLARGKTPVAVLISLKDYEERFAEVSAKNARRQLLGEIDAMAKKSSVSEATSSILKKARND